MGSTRWTYHKEQCFASRYFFLENSLFFVNLIYVITTKMYIFTLFQRVWVLFDEYFLLVSILKKLHWSRITLPKRYYENIQQTKEVWANLQENNHPKMPCIFIESALRHGSSPVNFLHIFRTSFYKNTSERLLVLIVSLNIICKLIDTICH